MGIAVDRLLHLSALFLLFAPCPPAILPAYRATVLRCALALRYSPRTVLCTEYALHSTSGGSDRISGTVGLLVFCRFAVGRWFGFAALLSLAFSHVLLGVLGLLVLAVVSMQTSVQTSSREAAFPALQYRVCLIIHAHITSTARTPMTAQDQVLAWTGLYRQAQVSVAARHKPAKQTSKPASGCSVIHGPLP